MLKLRLSMGGTKKRPVYKIVVADSKFPRDGRFIEKLGFFNPLLPKEKKERIGLQTDRIKYWLSQGAQPTTRVARLLGEHELIPMPAKGNNPMKAVPKKERKKEAKEEAQKRRRRKKQMLQKKLLKQRRKKQMLQKKLLKQRRKKQMLQKKLLKQRRKKQMLQKKLLKQRRKNKNVYSSSIYIIS